MENFRFQNSTVIHFGRDTHLKIGTLTKDYAQKVLIVYGSDRVKESGLLHEVTNSLEQEGIAWECMSGVVANPRLSKVNEGIAICKEKEINFLIALGGGSVIDTVKAIAMSSENADIWEYFEGKKSLKKTDFKIGVVLTISASGSESSGSTVITNDYISPNRKLDYTSNLLRPTFAILNPELTMSLNNDATAAGGIDILSHVMERYFTKVDNTALTDRLCEATMVTVIEQLEKLMDCPDDYDARAELMWAGTIAHNNILSTGRRSDWSSHMIEHEVSARYDIVHGDGLAMIIPSWMEYVMPKHVAIFSRYARKVWGIEGNDEYELARNGIERTRRFYEQLGKRTDLKKLGISKNELLDMARTITLNGPIGDLEVLGEEEVFIILAKACGYNS